METVRAHGNELEQAAEYLGLPPDKVRAAVSYFAAYQNEVDEFAERASAMAERAEAAWRREQQLLAS